jgi:hypothetical protein
MAEPQAPQKIDLSGYQTTPPPGAPPAAGSGVPSFGRTLGREVSAFGSAINPVNLVKGVYHAATDPVTAEEKQTYGPTEGADAHWYKPNMANIGPTGRLIVRGVAEPVEHAAEWYNDAAHGKHGDASAVESQMLDVAPEALGTAGGTVVGARALQSGANLVKNAGVSAGALPQSTPRVPVGTDIIGETRPGTVGGDVNLPFRGVATPVVRNAVRGVNVATQKLPEVAGGALGAGAGELVAGPKGAAVGGAAGAGVGRALRGVIPEVPGEDFGLTTMEKQGVSNPDVMRIQDQVKAIDKAYQRVLDDPNLSEVQRHAKFDELVDQRNAITNPKGASVSTPDDIRARLNDPRVQAEAGMRNMAQVMRGNGAMPAVAPKGRMGYVEPTPANEPGLVGSDYTDPSQRMARPATTPTIRGVQTPVEDAHPVTLVRDEHGNILSEDEAGNQTDGRHRIIQALDRGDETIPVRTKMRDGSYQTLNVPPARAAEMFGVDKESLAATDSNQPWRKGNLQPREAVTKTEAGDMSPAKPVLDQKVEGSLRHVIGDYATDNLIDSPEGAEAAQSLKKMSYKQLADTANYEGVLKPKSMVSKSGKEWTEADFKRSVAEHGKELNPNKEMVIRHLVDHYEPKDIMERIGASKGEE